VRSIVADAESQFLEFRSVFVPNLFEAWLRLCPEPYLPLPAHLLPAILRRWSKASVHFLPVVYEQMNDLLLNHLCSVV
jgi:hypothetical protein